jgi:hypothetical protein
MIEIAPLRSRTACLIRSSRLDALIHARRLEHVVEPDLHLRHAVVVDVAVLEQDQGCVLEHGAHVGPAVRHRRCLHLHTQSAAFL